MAETTSIVATLAAIKTSIDIIKAVKDADYDLDKAILKEKIAILIDSLMDAKLEALETLEQMAQKDNKIAELEEAFVIKDNLIRYGDGYYEVEEGVNPIGDPYCAYCWESSKKAIHLYYGSPGRKDCPNCKNSFKEFRVPNLSE